MLLPVVSAALVKFQFTHPGGVRPYVAGGDGQRRAVSIHAPGRGATTLANNKTDALVVSIHAPGRGATDESGVTLLSELCFNSRTREGCDFRGDAEGAGGSLFQFTHPGGVRRGRHLI